MSTFFIEAADVLFFKDGREIAPGSEYSAASLFPPQPGTIYGALRAAIIANHPKANFNENHFDLENSEVGKIVGSKEVKGELKILNFSIASKDNASITQFFKLPFDVLKRKKPNFSEGEKEEILISRLLESKKLGIKMNSPLQSDFITSFKHEEGAHFSYESRFISIGSFYAYLRGDFKNKDFENELIGNKNNQDHDNFFIKEPRIGIVINRHSNSVDEGKLFTTPFIRPNLNIGFFIKLNIGTDILTDQLLLRLGGDGKLALVKHINESDQKNELDKELSKKIENANHLKMILSTPAIFQNGWIPDGINKKTGIGEINGVTIKLIGASIGKPDSIGGWNVAGNHPKNNNRAVPAGSVFYFDTETPKLAFEKLHKASICNNEFNKQGLGITYLGVNKYYV